MSLSVLDFFKVGIGPSSSHTVGPMKAAGRFVSDLRRTGLFDRTQRVRIELCGSLGATGKGHGSDKAVLLGLEGHAPETVDTEKVDGLTERIHDSRTLWLGGERLITFVPAQDLAMIRKPLALHPNAVVFRAFDANGVHVHSQTFYSVGGGFVLEEAQMNQTATPSVTLTYPFDTARALLTICQEQGLSISDVMLANEKVWRSPIQTRQAVMALWDVMQACVEAGLRKEGIMAGGLKVERRAAALHRQLIQRPATSAHDPLEVLDWVSVYALAVNEENATGGRVVTAPTNGAAGIIPAVLHYYRFFVNGACDDGVQRFLLTAAAIGILYKKNASLSGAEVGCQGEIGVACSMAAAALCEVLGGSPAQVENAAEIGMEHNLGLTCDPIGGLVQVPCIERNAMGAMKAINAARLALRGDGRHFVSLDKVICTMRQTGADMKSKYKETARGGLAVNLIEC